MVVLYVLLALLALFVLTLACLALFTAYTAWQVERLLPPEGRFLDIDGARIHYLDLGEGPPIVFIHGLAGQLQHFTYALTRHLVSGHRLIVFDRPGSGYSVPRPAGTAGIRAQAGILAKAIEMLKLDKPLIVGHSLGGAVSLAIAQDYPKLAGGLALIAPLTHPVAAPPEAFKAMEIRSAFLRRLISWTLAVPMTILPLRGCLPSYSPRKRDRMTSERRPAVFWGCGRAHSGRLRKICLRPPAICLVSCGAIARSEFL